MDKRRDIKQLRQSIRLKNYDYSRPGFYFVTICVKNRICCLGDILVRDEFAEPEILLSKLGMVIKENLLNINNYFTGVVVDEWIIMPNHLHAIVGIIEDVRTINNYVGVIHELPLPDIISRRQMLLGKIIGKFKMNSAKQINHAKGTPGQSFWQKNYYEHIVKTEKSHDKIRNYIIDNPRRWHEDPENPNNKPDRSRNINIYYNGLFC